MFTKLALVAILAFAACRTVSAEESATRLRDIKTIWVGEFEGQVAARAKIVETFRKSGKIQLVEDAEHADAVLTGTASYEKKEREPVPQTGNKKPRKLRPIYNGHIAVELVNRDKKVLWSTEAGHDDPNRKLAVEGAAHKAAKKLIQSIEKDSKG